MKTNNNKHFSEFVPVRRSLAHLLGRGYVNAVSEAHAWLFEDSATPSSNIGEEAIDFYPQALQQKLAARLDRVGQQVIQHPLESSPQGAGSVSFNQATHADAAPLSAQGYYRVGEDGRLYLVAKSEHYHTSLGHLFPGYKLLDHARSLGIPNATHNNTRGAITRILERELIRTANGLDRGDEKGLEDVLRPKQDLQGLNRVLNLETGSLAVEAGLKMMLARFYRLSEDMAKPKYEGRAPVFLVMGDDGGNSTGNYHGTTILTQMMRGMWPAMNKTLERAGLWKVVSIRPNCKEDLDRAFEVYERGSFKIAGFLHEIIMMNYGGRRLDPDFLIYAHALADRHDVPTLVDEIQSCMWSSKLYLFREYGLRPTFVAIGKGFPGGEYPASRLIFSSAMDVLPLFGALVTNGQEELASLAYLVTMEWVSANGDVIEALGAYYHKCLVELADQYPEHIEGVDGWNHMTTLRFRSLERAKQFAAMLTEQCVDVSAQTYKADCPPVVLAKLPVIADRAMIDWVVNQMRTAMKSGN